MAEESIFVEVPISEETYALLEDFVIRERAKGNAGAGATVDSVAADLLRSWLHKREVEQGEANGQPKEKFAESSSQSDCEGD